MDSTSRTSAWKPSLVNRLRELTVDRSPDNAVADLRGRTTTRADRSAHRRHAWHYEDLLA